MDPFREVGPFVESEVLRRRVVGLFFSFSQLLLGREVGLFPFIVKVLSISLCFAGREVGLFPFWQEVLLI